MTPAATMLRATQLLDEDAQAGLESCQVGDRKWACGDCEKDIEGKCQAQNAHDERRRVAVSLRLLAEGFV